jgi:hypothetical protein
MVRFGVNLGVAAALLFIGVTLLPAAIVKSRVEYQNAVSPLQRWIDESSVDLTQLDSQSPDHPVKPASRLHKKAAKAELFEFDSKGYKKVQNMYEAKMVEQEDGISTKIAKWNQECKALLLKHLANFPDFDGSDETAKAGAKGDTKDDAKGAAKQKQLVWKKKSHLHKKSPLHKKPGEKKDAKSWHPALSGIKPSLKLCKIHFGIQFHHKKNRKAPKKYKSVGVCILKGGCGNGRKYGETAKHPHKAQLAQKIHAQHSPKGDHKK